MPQRPLEARRALKPARAKQPDAATQAAVRFREATEADVPPLIALINAAYKPVDSWLFEALRTDGAELRDALASSDKGLIVAELDGDIVGHVALTLHPGEPDLGLVAVAPEAQGRGIATLLIAEAERRTLAAGEPTLNLHCVKENGLVAYYASLGYAQAGEESGRMWDAKHEFTLVHMAKDLR